jgi:hypothetical protein
MAGARVHRGGWLQIPPSTCHVAGGRGLWKVEGPAVVVACQWTYTVMTQRPSGPSCHTPPCYWPRGTAALASCAHHSSSAMRLLCDICHAAAVCEIPAARSLPHLRMLRAVLAVPSH